MEKHHRTALPELMHLGLLVTSIPAFYLVLAGPDAIYRTFGHFVYALLAFGLLVIECLSLYRANAMQRLQRSHYGWLDRVIVLGTLLSAYPTGTHWNAVEWTLRLGYCGLVFARMPSLLFSHLDVSRLWQVCLLAVSMLALGGAGFLWLEPSVETYADGIWLAFTTGATVGYGDLVPTTPAARILAAFIVLIGYAIFSLVTANIAAFLVGEDEKKLRKELHADLRALRKEIAQLQQGLVNRELTSMSSLAKSPMTIEAGDGS